MEKKSSKGKFQASKNVIWPFLFIFGLLVASYLIYYSTFSNKETKIDPPVGTTPSVSPTSTIRVEVTQSITSTSTVQAAVDAGADKNSLPPQGLYESCLPSDANCLPRLAEMSAKGFKVVMNDGLRYAGSAKSLVAYADAAQKLGMKIILPVKYSSKWDGDNAFLVNKYSELAQECSCSTNEEFIIYYINTLKGHPALWGYYIADEIHLEDYKGLKFYADIVKRTDPDHPRLIVEEGSNDPMELFFTFPSVMSDVADVLGVDYYPYGYIDTYNSLSRFTGDSARLTQLWANKLNIKSAMVLQAYAQPQYYDLTDPLCMVWPVCAPFPNYEQILAQRDQVLLNSKPEMILWFSYPDILSSDDPAKHWSDLVAAAFAPSPTSAFASPAPARQDCPADWFCEDIGFPHLPGTQSLTDGLWKIEGAGWDIWSNNMENADQFHFVWQNNPAVGEISARLVSHDAIDNSAKSGIMLRKTFDPVSPYYAILTTPKKGIFVQYRTDFREDPVRTNLTSRDLPVFLKIVRDGITFSAYISDDAKTWTLLPNSRVDLPGIDGPLMAGLATSSGDETSTSTAVFDQVNFLRLDQ